MTVLLGQPCFASEPEYPIIPGKEYSVLVSETLNNKKNRIIRVYDVYSGRSGILDTMGSLHYGTVEKNVIYTITLPFSFPSIVEAKKWLGENDPSELRLRPFTIVSETVFNQWIEEGYRQPHEYWEMAPKGLVVEDIKPDYSIIPKLFLLEGYKTLPQSRKIRVYVNGNSIHLPDSAPYQLANGEILIPINYLGPILGYQTDYSTKPGGEGVLTLQNENRKIKISVWWDYILINDHKVAFEVEPRLSLTEKIMTPLKLLNFLAEKVEWDPDHLVINIKK
jgi:hypothetical protein